MKVRVLVTILSTLLLFLSVFPAMAGDETASPGQKAAMAADDERFMRQAFDLAISSGKNGNHTFGALLVHQGKVILTTENTVYTDKDSSRHAEMNLMVRARREFSPKVLGESTMYASTAPCMLCCAGMWYSGIRKVVYGVSYEGLVKLTGLKDNSLHCDQLYQSTDKSLEWVGPILEEEGLKVFCCWPQDAYRSSILKNLGGCEEMAARCGAGSR